MTELNLNNVLIYSESKYGSNVWDTLVASGPSETNTV
jgi:hypothetical protein